MRLSLRYRLLAPLVLLLAGDAAATAWAARSAAAHADRRIADQLRAVARTLTEPPTFPLTARVLEQMKGLSGAEFLLVRADRSRAGTFPAPLPDPPAGATDLGDPVAVAGAEYRCLAVPLRPPHRDEGGTLFVFYPEGLRRTAVWDAARPALLLGGGGGLVAVALGAAAGGRVVRRVRALDRQARAIADGDFSPAPLPAADDELRDLAAGVNDMARRLADYRDRLAAAERLRVLGQFAGGLAHQLRNAAAGAKLAVQLHRDDCRDPDPEPLEVALRQLGRIESTLTQFLNLGRPPTPRRLPVDLRAVVAAAVDLLRPQCRHTGTAMAWEPPADPAVVPGDAMQLGHLVGNLLGNAVDAAGPGGTVGVTLTSTGSGWRLEVSDSGPGPAADVAGKLFDPFVTGKEQGIGLGLAVAKQAADAHGGEIGWERRDGRTVFWATVPAA